VAGNACASATRWKKVSTVSVPVLRRTPGGPHLPPGPLPLPVGERKGERAAWGKRRSPNPSRAAPGATRSAAGTCGRWREQNVDTNVVVARARYVPNKKFRFLIRPLAALQLPCTL
jgi:hypothetical protein